MVHDRPPTAGRVSGFSRSAL